MLLTRVDRRSDGIFGELRDTRDQFVAYTLEHAYSKRPGASGLWEPKLPPGTYLCVKGVHRLAHGDPFTTFEITGVPNHTGILFHTGNWQSDSSGCVLLGSRVSDTGILESQDAFTRFMNRFENSKAFYLHVV